MEQSIQFQFKAQYFQTHQITKDTKEVWFVLHGYGMLAKYFIRKFHHIASEERVIIAPGGLSRFYLDGFKGRVGATWMTKEDRLIDIENYIKYLDAVYEEVSKQLENPGAVKFHFLGFSQGAATVTRWIQFHRDDFERLILWAGNFPHDMDVSKLSNKLDHKPVVMVRGLQDPFINEEVKLQQKKLIDALGITVESITFEGKHDIDEETLKLIAGGPVKK